MTIFLPCVILVVMAICFGIYARSVNGAAERFSESAIRLEGTIVRYAWKHGNGYRPIVSVTIGSETQELRAQAIGMSEKVCPPGTKIKVMYREQKTPIGIFVTLKVDDDRFRDVSYKTGAVVLNIVAIALVGAAGIILFIGLRK